MNTYKKLIIISGIIIFSLALSYFLIHSYTEKQYSKRLPSIPELNGTSASLQKQINEANENAHDTPSSKNLGELGMVYHANNYFDEAEKCYQLAIKKSPEDWKWNYYLGCLKRELGDSENATKSFHEVLKINTRAYSALYYIGEAYQQMDSTSKAEEILKKLSTTNKEEFKIKNTKRTSYFPLPIYAKLQMSKLYLNAENYGQAEKQLKELIDEQITFGPAYRQLSILYAQKGNSELSNYYSERSNDLNIYISPVDTLLDQLSLYSRSEMYLLKQIDDAIRSSNSFWALELVKHSLQNIPDNPYIISKAIKQFIDMQAVKQALPYLDKHLQAFANNYQELIEVGVRLADSGYQNEARRYFLAAENIKTESVEIKSTLAGMFYEKLGMKNKATELINELLNKYPKNTSVISASVFLFIQTEEMESANRYLKLLKQLSPSNPDINVLEGIIAQKQGDIRKSVRYFEKALKDNPDKKLIIDYLANYYLKNEMWEKAINLYQTALKHDPNSSDLQESLSSLFVNCPNKEFRNPKLGKEYSERAFINCKYTLQTRISAGKSLAIAHFQLRNPEKAYSYITETIDIAQKARASKEYINNLKRISADFERLINSTN